MVRRTLEHKATPIFAGAAAAAAALATTAVLVHRSARRAEERHPPKGRFIEVDGVRLHYLERGEGEPVVLLHGLGTMSQDFVASGLFDELASRYRVIALDRPGFGYSERPRFRVWTPDAQAMLVKELSSRLGLDRPAIVGHSWGTMVALALALGDPQAVRGLLLISGYYYPTPRLDVVLGSPPALPIIGDLMRYTISPLLARLTTPVLIRKMFAPKPVPDGFSEEVPLQMMLRPSQLRADAAELVLMVPAAASLAPRYAEIELPVTIVTGKDDRIVDYQAHSSRLHREIPDSTLMTLPGVGHMAHYAAKGQLASAVDDFFAAQPQQAMVDAPATVS
jgi:pimeloyl-ACP methyl ester carboxylesterase